MSYCRKEGKDIIVFATEEDLSGPSKVSLLPDDPNDLDTSHQGAILPNGEINWDCPCLGNLPNGPCGPMFRDAFSCWAENKNDQESFATKCFDNFMKWESCLSENRDIYKSDKHEDPPESDTTTAKHAEPSTIQDSMLDDDILDAAASSIEESRPAIAAAFAEEDSR